jgi:hypothetical protein
MMSAIKYYRRFWAMLIFLPMFFILPPSLTQIA